MPRWTRLLAAALVLTAAGLLVWWLTARSGDEVVLFLPEGEAVLVPETDLQLTYNGIGHATTLSGGGEAFISYLVARADGSVESIYDSLDGQQFPPWRVVSTEGEWLPVAPEPTLLERVKYWLQPSTRPAKGVVVHLERVTP